MINKTIKLGILLLILATFTSACSISFTDNKSGGVDSSVFLSTNYGDSWRPMTALKRVSGDKSIANVNVNTMSMDPSDHLAVYLATVDQGLYYTYKISEGWNKVESLPSGNVFDVQVDPKNKCTIYASVGNKLYRSVDCSRTWNNIYYDNNAQVTINTIVIDHYNDRNIYIGTSRGEIIKSIDGGESWRTIKRLDSGVSKLIGFPSDSRLFIVATKDNKLYSFISRTDSNINPDNLDRNFIISDWTDLNKVLKDYDIGNDFKDLVISAKNDTVLLATNKSLLRSTDFGISWEKLNLIPAEKDAVINAIAIDDSNSKNIYYITNTTFYRSKDGGVTWTTKKLPGTRAGKKILVDFENSSVLYLGTIKLKK